ncbi:MAG: AraC family transcriptional regulator [bacterium]
MSQVSNVHHRYMLILNLKVEIKLMLDSILLDLEPGQALLVFPFQSHRYLAHGDTSAAMLFITFEMPDTELLADFHNHPVNIAPDLWPLVTNLMEEYKAAYPEKPADAVPVLLSILLLRLLRQIQQQPTVRWDSRQALPAHRLVQRACRFIETHRADPELSVTGVAKKIFTSTSYLRTCFQKVLGLKVVSYIRRARVFAACALLSRTDQNITNIAEACGFSSIYAFSRAFMQEIGQSPTHYRTHLWKDRNKASPPVNRRKRKR